MIKEYMKSIGYSDEEIETIVNSYGMSSFKTETLFINIKKNYCEMMSQGYTKDQIIK